MSFKTPMGIFPNLENLVLTLGDTENVAVGRRHPDKLKLCSLRLKHEIRFNVPSGNRQHIFTLDSRRVKGNKTHATRFAN